MLINVVTVRSGWILQKIAERIAEAGNEHFSHVSEWKVSHHPKMHNAVNFYCDVQNCYMMPTNCLDIGLFTHIHENNPANVNKTTFSLDYIFHMSSKYMREFSKIGYPSKYMDLMVPFETPANWEVRKPTLGIFQRGKYEGKGFNFMLNFASNPVCKLFKWVFVGNDWGDVAKKLDSYGCDVVNLRDSNLKYPEGYEFWYSKVDHVLIPSKWEGGPVACLEAMTLGIPVISADVGWCREWGAKIFKDENHLSSILSKIGERERVKARKVRYICSYKRCAEQIISVIC